LAELLAKYNGYPVTGDIGYPTPGSFGTWAGVEAGIPVITLELPRGERGEESWRSNGDGLAALTRAVRPLSRSAR
jgi:protein MpaA